MAYNIQIPRGPGIDANPAMKFMGNAALELADRAAEEQHEPVITGLAGYLNMKWEEAKHAKQEINARLSKCIRQRKGEYDQDVLSQIREIGGSEIYMMLTAEKCRAHAATIKEQLDPVDDRPWTLKTRDNPELSPDVEKRIIEHARKTFMPAQGVGADDQAFHVIEDLREQVRQRIKDAAKRAAKKHETVIDDQLKEGGYPDAMDEFVEDYVTYPTAFMEGPLLRKKKTLRWEIRQGLHGSYGYEPVADESIKHHVDRISPWDIYPGRDSRNLNDGDLIIRRQLRVSSLNALIGVPGYSEDAIRMVIMEYGQGGLREWINYDQERHRAENRPYMTLDQSNLIDCLHYYTEAPGLLLIQWGMAREAIPDPTRSYQVQCWKIGGWVIRASLDDSQFGTRNIYGASFENVPGSIWGNALPELIEDDQRMCNASARALANNMGIASGPQVVLNDTNRKLPGENYDDIYPWRIWQFQQDEALSTSYRPPVEFFQPNPMVDSLLSIFDFFSRRADEHSMMPSYTYGAMNKQGGALETYGGMALAQGNANKVERYVIGNIDKGVVKNLISAMYMVNMLHHKDPSIKADLFPQVRGSKGLLAKQQKEQARVNALKATGNEVDLSIMGKAGRANLLREALKPLDMNIDEIVPKPDGTVTPEMSQLMEENEQLKQQLAAMNQEIESNQQETVTKIQGQLATGRQRGEFELRKQAMKDRAEITREANQMRMQQQQRAGVGSRAA